MLRSIISKGFNLEFWKFLVMGDNNTKYVSSSDISELESEYEDCEESNQDKDQNITSEETDATLRIKASLPKAQMIDVNKVYEIEDQLDIGDIVSLVYLLSEDGETEYCLQVLSLLLSGGNSKILSEWAQHHSSRDSNWQNKLVEALCIIKHYSVLKFLGYEKSIVSHHFLPNFVNSIHVNKLRKAVYLICDSFDLEDTKTFLNYVREEYKRRNIVFDEYGTDYLEIYFLKWESIKLLDFHKIKLILKNMHHEHGYNILDSVLSPIPEERTQDAEELFQNARDLPSTSFQIPGDSQSLMGSVLTTNTITTSRVRKESSTSVDNNIPKERSPFGRECSGNSMSRPGKNNVNRSTAKNTEPRYDIDPKNPGVVLIINQEHFYTEIDEKYKDLLPPDSIEHLPTRTGSTKDKDKLVKVFEAYGFKVIVSNNVSHIEMIQQIRTVLKEVTMESSLFICIMSHGEKGLVYGSNSCHVKVSKIQEMMCDRKRANLAGKPKVLILQSCQGQQCLLDCSDDEFEENTSLTTDGPSSLGRDLLTFWATIPGYAAIRNKETGSWFIQAFCKMLFECGNRNHLVDICTRTAGEVAQQIWITREQDRKVMTPMVNTTLLKSFYLPPLPNIQDFQDIFL